MAILTRVGTLVAGSSPGQALPFSLSKEEPTTETGLDYGSRVRVLASEPGPRPDRRGVA